MSAPFDFSGQSVFVAGGTTGINLGIAQAFARAGARVWVISRKEENVKNALQVLRAQGAQAGGGTADVRDFEQVKAALKGCAQAHGPLDVVVSGAAGNFPARARDLSSNGFRAVLEIDVLGTHHVLTAAYPHLRKPGASIINVSAPQAVVAMSGQVHVCAAKAGVDMITKTLALEWGREGIRVNSVLPGPIDGTEGMQRLAPSAEARAMVQAGVPLGRLGKADDVAGVCLFLASPLAAYVSGVVLPVDGGWSLNLAGSMLESLVAR